MKAKLTTEKVNSYKSKSKHYKVWDTEIKGFYLLVSVTGVKSFVFFYRINGKAKSFTIGKLGKLTVTIARKEATRLAGEVAAGIDIMAAKQKAVTQAKRMQRATLGDFLEKDYLPHAKTHLKSYNETKRVLFKDFSHLHLKRMDQISAWSMKTWQRDQLKNSLKPATINRRLGVLKAVLALAAESGVIEQSPLAGMAQLKVDKNEKVRYLNAQEEQRLRQALDARQDEHRVERQRYNQWRAERDLAPLAVFNDTFTDYLKPMVIIALNTGMRRGELFKLAWHSVNLKARVITVEGAQAKSGNTRHIPMNDEVFSALVAWRNQNEVTNLVFPSPVTGGQLDNISTSWGRLIDAANIDSFRFHDLRHHFASKLVMKGVDLLTVKELLGHSNLDMTLRYAHLAPEHKAAAVALLNEVEN